MAKVSVARLHKLALQLYDESVVNLQLFQLALKVFRIALARI